jgi:hypothetical protein
MKSKFKVGDQVITLRDYYPYYSNYAGNPVVLIPKGSVGIIGAVDVPKVSREGTFNCVDFIVPDKFDGNPELKQNKWRCAISDEFLQKT